MKTRSDSIPVPNGADGTLTSALTSVEQYLADKQRAPQQEAFFDSSDSYPNAVDWPYCRIYFTDKGKPAWSTGGAWKYADGSAAP